ncbi:DUF1622 domain-containing protein [soil metagenome]
MAADFKSFAELVGLLLDAVGIAVIVFGFVYASFRVLQSRTPGLDRYNNYRQNLGRAILLGLELLVAGDIIKTIAVDPTLNNMAVLAVIVVIRTFLSFSLELEISGRWPWQAKSEKLRAADDPL